MSQPEGGALHLIHLSSSNITLKFNMLRKKSIWRINKELKIEAAVIQALYNCVNTNGRIITYNDLVAHVSEDLLRMNHHKDKIIPKINYILRILNEKNLICWHRKPNASKIYISEALEGMLLRSIKDVEDNEKLLNLYRLIASMNSLSNGAGAREELNLAKFDDKIKRKTQTILYIVNNVIQNVPNNYEKCKVIRNIIKWLSKLLGEQEDNEIINIVRSKILLELPNDLFTKCIIE